MITSNKPPGSAPSGTFLEAQETEALIGLFNEGRYCEAEQCAWVLTTRFPRNNFVWKALGAALSSQERAAEALDPIKKAIALAPEDAEAQSNLGNALKSLGRFDEAEACYQRALDLEPDYAEAHFNLGITCNDLGRLHQAETCYRRALEITPDYAEAHYNLGITLHDLGRLDEAEASCRRALRARPDYARAYSCLGIILNDLGRLDEAETSYRRALNICPGYVEAYYNLGITLDHQGRLGEAEGCYRRALDIKPDYPEAYYNLGHTLKDLDRPEEALACYLRALEIKPDYAEACSNLGLLLLFLGRYAEAWPICEYRYHPIMGGRSVTLPDLPFPQWRGESLAGRSLLIWPEQGYGDYIQFARYAALLKGRGLAKLTLVCDAPLKALLETAPGGDAVIGNTKPVPPHDYWSFPLSLPLHFGTTLQNIPTSVPYLHPLSGRLERWRACLPDEGLKVGLVWKGSTTHQNDGNRSLAGLATLAPLWSVPGITFISLQKGQGEEEALQSELEPLIHLGADLKDFADTAAIVAQLDLVICVDTAIAHVAGALGRPCWLLLPSTDTDWRWMRERVDSPWYPGVMRLFRQGAKGDWASVITRVVRALEVWALEASLS